MEYFFKQLKRLRDATSLDAQKKAAVRSEIVNYMRATGAVREQEVTRHSIGKRSATLTNAKTNMKFIRFAALVAVLVLLGGGTSFAAERALPGDALYPVKVNVNEKVSAAFQLSAEDKANFDARLAERRLAEAGTLAARGRLNAEASARVQKSFEEFSARVEARIEALRESGNEEAAEAVSSRFEASLEAHARALEALKARFEAGASASSTSSDSGNFEAIIKLGMPVRAALKSAQGRYLDAQAKASSSIAVRGEAAAEARIDAADESIDDARRMLADKKGEIGAEISAKAEAELDSAEALLVRAKARAEAEAYVDAILMANRAARTAHQVKFLLNLQAKIGASADGRVWPNTKNIKLDLFGNTSAETEADANVNVNVGGGVNVQL